jgi:hypothetical protein
VRSFSPSNCPLVQTPLQMSSPKAPTLIQRLTDVLGIQAARGKKWNADSLTMFLGSYFGGYASGSKSSREITLLPIKRVIPENANLFSRTDLTSANATLHQ